MGLQIPPDEGFIYGKEDNDFHSIKFVSNPKKTNSQILILPCKNENLLSLLPCKNEIPIPLQPEEK